jgi:autotransporter-associated beta strand protein
MSVRQFRKFVQSIFTKASQRRGKSRRSRLFVEDLESRVVPTSYTWNQTAAGAFDWNNPANWTPNTGFPNAAGDVANINAALAGNETINLNIPITVGTINIGASSGTSTFTVAANGGALTLSDPVSASIGKTAGGADQISAGLTLSSNLNVANSAVAPLALGGVIASTGRTVAINPAAQTGEVDFTAASALNTGNISVGGGTLGINTNTLNSNRTITIAAGAVVASSGTLNLNAQQLGTYPDAVSGLGTLRLTSTTNNAGSPDIYFNPNDALATTNPNLGNRISANVDLGSSQRYIYVYTNHNSLGSQGQNADAIINGVVSGSGGITLIGQNSLSDMEAPLVLGGANTFTGTLEIQRGSVYLNNAAALAQGNAVVMDPAAGNNARLFLYGNNATIGSLSSSGQGSTVIANGNLNNPLVSIPAATLTVTQSADGSFSGQILDYFLEYSSHTGTGTTGAISLVKAGTAALTLTADYVSGNPVATGTTTVNAGTLLVSNTPSAATDSGLPTGNVVVNSGGTIAGTGSIVPAAASTFTVNTGGTLSGLLTIAATVVDNGTVKASGKSTNGQLTTGDLTLSSGSTFTADLNGTILGNGYNQVLSTGTATLGGATLVVNPNFPFTGGTAFDILSATTISGTFNGAPEGATLTFGGQDFTITYAGGTTGTDVVLKRKAPPIVYADTAWVGLANGTVIPDADPVQPGAQSATIGTTAFATVDAAIAAVPALGTVIVNGQYTGGGDGTFGEDVVVNKEITLLVQAGPATFGSLADSVANSVISLSLDSTSAPITLTVGGSSDTTVLGAIVDPGNFVKAGTGTLTLSGADTYSGTTTVSAGTLQAGSATGLSPGSAYTVNGTLALNGFSGSIASLAGSGTVQNANATAATLTVGVPPAGSTFSGTFADGPGGGAFSLVITGTTGTFTLSGTASSYTGSTTIGGGTLSIAALANGGSNSSIGASTNDPANLVLQGGGTLLYTGVTATTDRGFSLGAGGGILTDSTASSTLTIGGNINNTTNPLTVGGAANFSFGGSFTTGGSGAFTDNGPGNVTFTNPTAFGTPNTATTWGNINTGNVTVNSGDLTLGSIRVNEAYRPGGFREISIGSGAFVTATGTVDVDPNGNVYVNQIIGPGTLQLRDPNATKTNPSLTEDLLGGDGGPWGAVITATVDVGSGPTQVIVGSTNRNDVSRYSGDLRFDGPLVGSAGLQTYTSLQNSGRNMRFCLTADNSGFTGPVFIANTDLDLCNNNALTAANSVTFNSVVDPKSIPVGIMYLWGHSVTIGSLNDMSAPGTTSFIRNGALDATNGGTSANHGGIALGVQADSILTINQTVAGVFNGQINDGPNDNGAGASGTYRTLSIVKTGSATLTLTGANAYSGTTTISGGTLSVTSLANGGTTVTNGLGNAPSGIGSSANAAANLVLDGGTLQYTGPAASTDRLFTVTGNGGTLDASGTGALVFSNTGAAVFSGAATTLTLTGTSTAQNSLAAILANGTAATSVTKTGPGTWDLTGVNTYTGATAVNAGTLLVDGTLAGGVTVAAGTTLGGTGGTVTGAVAVSGTLSAGNATTTGILNVGNLSFSGTGAALGILLSGTTVGTGYDKVNGTGSVNLTGAALNLSVTLGFNPATGTTFDILGSGSPITGTFTGLAEGATFGLPGGDQFSITYKGGAGGHDVVLTRVPTTTVYVDTAWAGLASGTAIPDADPVAAGAQPAVVGTTAFATVDAAVAAVPTAFSFIIVNGHYTGGGSGNFTEDVNLTKPETLIVQAGPTSFGSLASVAGSVVILGMDTSSNPITLTVGGDNATTNVSASISGAGSLVKAGTGAMTLAGVSNYTGSTTVNAGTLQGGSTTAFGTTSGVTVATGATLALGGFNVSVGSVAGAGTIEDGSATPATLTVGTASNPTFSGILQDGTGGGALSLATTGTGTFTLSGTASTYTGSTTASGTLSVALLANGGIASSIGAASNSPANLVLQGTLLYTGPTASTDRGFTLSGPTTITENTAATTLTIGGNIANGTNGLTLGGAGNLSFGGVFTGTTGTLTVAGPGNATFTNRFAFGSLSDENNYGTITTGNITVSAGDLTVVDLRLNETQRPGAVREASIAAGAFLTTTGTLSLDPDSNVYLPQVAGPGTLQLRNPNASKTDPSLGSDFGPSGGDAGPWGTALTAVVDVGSGPTQWIVGKANRNDVSRYAGDLRFDNALTGSASIQVVGLVDNNAHNFHFVLNADNSGVGGLAPFTGAVFIADCDLALANNNALTGASAVTFDSTVDPNTTSTGVLFLYGHNVTIGSLNDTSDSGTSNFIRNGALDAANGGTNSHNNSATNGVALGLQADSTLTINQTVDGVFNGKINDGPNDDATGDNGTYRTLSIVKTGPAKLALTGSNAYTGSTTLSGGILSVTSLANGGTTATNGLGDSPSGIGASNNGASNLVFDGGTLQYTGPAASTDRLFTITGNGGTLDASGGGALQFTNATALTFSGTAATTFTLAGTSTAGNTFAPILTDGTGPTSLVKTGAGLWDLTSANTYTGTTKVNGGTLQVDGSLTSAVTVAAGATLAGSGGTVNAAVSVSGALSAGNGTSTTGLFTVGNLSFGTGGAFDPLLGGTTAGTGYDQVTGSGTINLTNAALNVSLAAGFTPAVGTQFDILTNTGGSNITGTFASLPEGTTFSVGASAFKITYVGGTSGRDVVLTAATPINSPPNITSPDNTSFTVGVAGTTFTVVATGSPAPTLSESGTLPNNLQFNPTTGVLSGTPAVGTGGVYHITFTATNSSGTVNQPFTLTINEAPAITSANSATFSIGVQGTFTVKTTGTPAPALTETGATLPSGVMFHDNGDGTATISGMPAAGTAGPYAITITANNGVTPNATQPFTLTVTAAAGPTNHFAIVGPATAAVGTPVNFTITALDQNNVPTGSGYTGTVHFTSTDGSAMLPVNGPLTNGTGVFSVTFTAPGTQTISASDTVSSGITGTSNLVTVTTTTSKLAVSAPSTATAGSPFIVTVTAQDSGGHTDTGYTGTVHLTSTDGAAVLPPDAKLTNGVGTFAVTLKTVTGSPWTVTATDTVTATITGVSGNIAVTPGAARFFNVVWSGGTTATTGVQGSALVTAEDVYGNVATGYTGTVHITSSDGAATLPPDAGLTNGTGNFQVTLNTAGNQTITASDLASLTTPPLITGTTGVITTRGLVVTGTKVGGSSVEIDFSKPFDPTKLTMYGSGLATVQDVKLVGATTGAITGTLYLDPSNMSATFKATEASLNAFSSTSALPDDNYTLTVVSGTTNGFVDAAGVPLDGANNAGHANYTTTFTVANGTKSVLWLPDFARGPDGANSINIPAATAGGGIPVTLTNATAVTDVTFSVTYNPALLTITGPTSGNLQLVGTPTGGVANFHYTNATAQNGTVVLGGIVASVPNSAGSLYKTKELLTLSNITVNTAAFTGVAASAIHVNAYLGDVTGNGTIDALDVATANNVATGSATGFPSFTLLDPAIVGDPQGDISVDAGDVSALAAVVAHLPEPTIPAIPSGVTITPVGADPTLSLSGDQASVSVLLDHPNPVGSTGMTEAILALSYDPKVLSVSSSDITLGSIPSRGTGWQISSVVDPATGQIGITLYSTTAITTTQAGSLVNIAFHVLPGATVSAASVQLINRTTPNGQQFTTQVDDAQGQFILSRGVDRLAVDTGVSRTTPVAADNVVAVVNAQLPVNAVMPSVTEESAGSLLSSETHDALAVMSNGAAAGETAPSHALPAGLIVTGALAFQNNAAAMAATQIAGQMFQVASAALVSTLIQSGAGPQQLVDRVFLALARYSTAVEAQDNLWDGANLTQDWLAIPTQTPAAATGNAATADQKAMDQQQAAAERIAVVDQVFALMADDGDDFANFGAND